MLNASNPGQFYYNVWYYGTPGDAFSLTITIPYPFVTQGANPIQVHNSFTTTSAGCYLPGPSLPGFTITTTGGTKSASGYDTIVLGDYSPQAIGSFTTVKVSGKVPAADTTVNPGVGLAYVTIHLDYGLKKTTGWTKSGDSLLTAINATYGNITSPQAYAFKVGGDITDSQNPTSINNFKKSVGTAGFTLKTLTENPVRNVTVELRDAKKALVGSAVTDEDGYYMINYKYTGKAATFYVNVPANKLSKQITLKANGFVIVDFPMP